MKNGFIKKLETENYYIGSFDVYEQESKDLIKNNSNLSIEEVEQIMKTLPTTYRATIIDKNNNYIGYISAYNIDAKNETTSIRFETNNSLNNTLKEEILNEYKKWLSECLNLNNINEYSYYSKEQKQINTNIIKEKTNIIIPCKLIEKGITKETL